MNQVSNPDELFNAKAREADLETPFDRFHDLILAVFRSTVIEACRQHAECPKREPDAGLVHDAAAWIHELMMPDVSRGDIARCIARWIVSQTELSQGTGAIIEQPQTTSFIGFM